MPVRIDKVLAYITHGDRLLVFGHPDSPEAGIQVPAGTVAAGETPREAVAREAIEETGLPGLEVSAEIGREDFPRPERGEVHRRHFFHLVCEGSPPERWRYEEAHPSDGTPGPIPFELFWVRLPFGVPELAPGHGALLSRLFEILFGAT